LRRIEANACTKKTYLRPRLIVYGDLFRLTQVKGGAMGDGGGGAKPRTRLAGPRT